MVKRLIGYTIDLDGSVTPQPDLRLRFNFHLKFDAHQVVQEFGRRAQDRPHTWEVRVDPARQTIALQHEQSGQRTSRILRLAIRRTSRRS